MRKDHSALGHARAFAHAAARSVVQNVFKTSVAQISREEMEKLGQPVSLRHRLQKKYKGKMHHDCH